MKTAGIIHRAKRFGNELVDRASNATLGLLPQTQFPTRWSLPPKTLEVLLKIRDMVRKRVPLKRYVPDLVEVSINLIIIIFRLVGISLSQLIHSKAGRKQQMQPADISWIPLDWHL